MRTLEFLDGQFDREAVVRDHPVAVLDQHQVPVHLPSSIDSLTRLEIVSHPFQTLNFHQTTCDHCIRKGSVSLSAGRRFRVSHDEQHGKNHRCDMLSKSLALHWGASSQTRNSPAGSCVSIVLQASHQRVADVENPCGHFAVTVTSIRNGPILHGQQPMDESMLWPAVRR